MNLILTVLEFIAPVIFLAVAGFAWVKLGFEYRIQFVTRLSMTLAVPCLIFTALMKSGIAPQDLTKMLLAAVLGCAALSLAAYGMVRLVKLEMRSDLAPVIFGNTGNLGLPLTPFAYGYQNLSYALVIFAISTS